MTDLTQVADLINDIYDAALDASRWPCVLLRAIAIGEALERSESRAAAFGDMLDRLSAAVVFVDEAGRLVHASGPAAAMLAEGETLRWKEGKPCPVCERAALHLQSLLASASRGHSAAGCAALYTTDTARSGERVAIHILPVPAGSRRQALAPCAAAILVSRLAPDLTQRVESISRLYAFTPAEARVTQALLESGATIGRVAGALGVGEATVKTHLQHIFDKTGARRRADLVQLIAAGGVPASDAPPRTSVVRDGGSRGGNGASASGAHPP